MKVLLYYEGFYPSSGGIETHIRDICENLPGEFEVVTDLHDRSLGDEPKLPHTTITRIGPKNTTTTPQPSVLNSRPFFPYRAATDLVRFRRTGRHLRTNDCDLAHFHGAGIGAGLARFIRMTGTGRLLRALPSNVASPVPRIATIHGLSLPSDRAAEELQGRFLSCFDTFICVDKHLPDMAKGLGAPPSAAFEYIPNSVDTKRFRPAGSKESSRLRIGFVGRLERSRGIGYLRALVEKLPPGVELRLALAASHVQLERFGGLLTKRGIAVRMNLPYEAMPEFYQGIDVVFNPVEVPGISRVSLESMACGKPVIMLAVGDRYPVEAGVTGFLISPSVESAPELVASLVGQRELLSRLGLAARNRVEREFGNDVVLPRIWRVYEKLAATH